MRDNSFISAQIYDWTTADFVAGDPSSNVSQHRTAHKWYFGRMDLYHTSVLSSPIAWQPSRRNMYSPYTCVLLEQFGPISRLKRTSRATQRILCKRHLTRLTRNIVGTVYFSLPVKSKSCFVTRDCKNRIGITGEDPLNRCAKVKELTTQQEDGFPPTSPSD